MDSTETSLYTFKAVGVGTIDPSIVKNWGQCLEVKGDKYKKLLVSTNVNDVRLGLYAHRRWRNATGSGTIGTESNHPLILMTNFKERMRVTTGGNFGIGTRSISNYGNWNRVMQIDGSNHAKSLVTSTKYGVIVGSYAHKSWGNSSGSGSIGTESNHPLRLITNYNEKMRITTDGYVGIGTRNPSQKLDVNGNINFTGNLYKNGVLWNSSNDWVSSSNGLYTNVGNVGIGTTNPSQKLDVIGNINFTGDLYQNGNVLTLSDSNSLVNDNTFVSNLYDKLHDNEINIYDTIKNGCSTVSFSLRGSNYTCSGSFITFDSSDLQYGLFMTAAHCVMEVNGTTVSITNELYVTNPITGDYTKIDVDKIYYDGVADVALIRTGIDFSSNSSYPLQLSTVTPQTGDICFLCGNPGGLDNVSLSQGFIRDARFYENGGYQVPESLYIDTPGIGGNSGSPILNKNGKIIGIFTFGSSTTGMETFGGGSNLSVLNSTLPVLKTQAISGSSNKRNTDKYYIGLDYWTQSNAPFTWKSYYGNASTFPNQGVRIYTVTSGISPFNGVLGYLDILLSATIDGVEYKFGELSDQYPPGIMLYKPVNPTITIKYLDYDSSYTEKTASVTLVTYGSSGIDAYLDAPLNTGASARNPENVQQLCFAGKR